MKINRKEYEKIKNLMPLARKPTKISNQQFLNALLYMIENGCKWRAMPKKFGNLAYDLHEVQQVGKKRNYTESFRRVTKRNIVNDKNYVLCLDSTSIKVHPDATGARKTNGKQSIGRSKGG